MWRAAVELVGTSDDHLRGNHLHLALSRAPFWVEIRENVLQGSERVTRHAARKEEEEEGIGSIS